MNIATPAAVRLVILASLTLAACAASPRRPAASPAAQGFADRTAAVARVLADAQRGSGRLAPDATPEQIAFHRSQQLEKVRAARAAARAGDLLTPDIAAEVKAAVAAVLTGPAGGAERDAVADEQPEKVPALEVNEPYPSAELGRSTMPPTLLSRLPPLPAAMEYRIVGDTLVLLARDAGVILDLLPAAVPKRAKP